MIPLAIQQMNIDKIITSRGLSAGSFSLSSPTIMGIINLTSNSACEIGKFQSIAPAVKHAINLIEQGADIIDVGAEGTNPGLKKPITSLEEELSYLIPFITALKKETDIPISVDTSKPEVMQAVVEVGATMINDVRALRLPGALETVARLNVPVCLMHMEYPYGVTESKNNIEDITMHVKQFLLKRVQACLHAGIKKEHIILDPGIGGGSFGKTAKQNLQLIKNTQQFAALGYPVLMGVSFKSFIGDILGIPIEKRSAASLASIIYAAQQGAAILRVHEVDKTKQAIDIVNAIKDS